MDKYKELLDELRIQSSGHGAWVTDLCNRAAEAIEELLNVKLHESCTDCPLYDKDNHRCPRFNAVIPTAIEDALAELLSEQPEQRWIPVSERLPETSDTYIATADMYGVTLEEEWYQGSIVRPLFYNAHRKKWSSEEENTWVDDVIAWQPLPEPYKGEEE